MLRLQNVSILRVVDLGLQNVVGQLWTSEKFDGDEELVARRLSWATSAVDAASYLSPSRVADLLESIRHGESVLVGVTPSAGAEVVALCARFIVEK